MAAEVHEVNFGKFRRNFPVNRCYLSRAEGESLQGVVRLKGASSDGTNFKGGGRHANFVKEHRLLCKVLRQHLEFLRGKYSI